ncbi:protein canopy 4-like isoform X1 [Littorina saxatilis]|uniref:protein canopy 4-like isoform X1 n=1 Tax=Littorina saxatilis TaxID=31220 RepID=UPI0038B60ECC
MMAAFTALVTHFENEICILCKYLAVELQGRLDETGKVRGFIETGHGLDPKQKKRKEYKRSELRLIEAMQEPHVCDKILEYNVHAERKKSLRYAKGQSETMKTLHGLVDKGVKVELGIPYEMWDQPSAEITNMQRSCFTLVEEYEEDIEEWYWGEQGQSLLDYLCVDRFLRGKDTLCLHEEFEPKGSDEDEDSEDSKPKDTPAKKKTKKNTKKTKGDTGSTTPPPTAPSPIPPPITDGEVKDEL